MIKNRRFCDKKIKNFVIKMDKSVLKNRKLCVKKIENREFCVKNRKVCV